MAERRMFAKTIIDSDAFIDMPVTARLLYYDLGMRADDDGFINAPKKIMRMIGASEDDMRILITRKFIIPFDTGVVVIKHWRINNYLRSDRYKETSYQEEKKTLTVKENGAYSITGIPVVDQAVYQRDTQDSIGKDSIGKYRLDKDSVVDVAPEPPSRDLEYYIKYWNAIPHTISIDSIVPMTSRYDEFRICLSMYGPDDVIRAMDKVRDSEYLKERGNIRWDKYMNRNVIQQLLEGAYDHKYRKEESSGSLWDFKFTDDDQC